MKQYRFHASLLAFLALIFALQAWLPGAIIPAIVPSAVPVPNKTASGTVRFLICDVNENCVIKGGYSTGSGSGATGSLALTGATSGSTVTVTVDTSTTSGTLKFPGVTGFLPAINGSITPGDCANWFSAVQLGDAGAACGSGGGTGAANPSCTFAGTATGCGTPTSIDVSAFNAATINQILVQCWTGAGTTQTPLTILTYVYTTGSGIVQTVAPTFSAAVAAGYCTANGNGSGGGGGSVAFPSPYVTSSGNTYAPLYQITPPATIGSWTWVNQGGSTAAGGGTAPLTLGIPANGGSDQQRIIVQALPAAPWTCTTQLTAYASTGGTASRWGLVLRDSASGKLSDFVPSVGTNGPGAQTMGLNWSTTNTFSSYNFGSGSANGTYVLSMTALHYLRIQDDGTNRTYQLSSDGLAWLTVFSVADTNFLTPNQCGIEADGFGGTGNWQLTVWDFSITTP